MQNSGNINVALNQSPGKRGDILGGDINVGVVTRSHDDETVLICEGFGKRGSASMITGYARSPR